MYRILQRVAFFLLHEPGWACESFRHPRVVQFFELWRLANRQGAGLQRVRTPIFDGSYIRIMETKIGDYHIIGL